MQTQPILEVRELCVAFQMYAGGLARQEQPMISDLGIAVHEGEILSVVGSSGSGKSLLAHAVLGILPDNATVRGEIRYRGETLTPKRQKELRGREIALIPQSVAYLDPLMRVREQVRGVRSDPMFAQRCRETLTQLGLRDVEQLYPFQLSGGMARRVLFATATVGDAELIIADEPTPGMQLSQATQALSILRELANQGKAVLLITHDLSLALAVSDRVAVFYAGTTVEQALVEDFHAEVQALRHPYSRALWAAMPQNEFAPLSGFQPMAAGDWVGCPFAPRCPQREAVCQQEKPPLTQVRGGTVRCHYAT